MIFIIRGKVFLGVECEKVHFFKFFLKCKNRSISSETGRFFHTLRDSEKCTFLDKEDRGQDEKHVFDL